MRLPAASALFLCVSPLGSWAGEPPPDTYAEARYSQLMSDSPFALATPTVAPSAPERSFAEGWTVIGLWQEKAENGTLVEKATIRTSEAKTFTLAGHDPDQDGVSIASVDWSDKPFSSTVMVKKGAESAKVEFIDPSKETPPPPVANPPRQGMRNPMAGVPHPPVTPIRVNRPYNGIPTPASNQRTGIPQVRPR